MVRNLKKVAICLLIGLIGIGAASCSGSSGSTTTSGITLTGTAATGGPAANATITIKDKNGQSKKVVTDSSGNYTADVSGLTAPFLLQVAMTSGSSGTVLYSVAGQTGTANIHPLTDLIVEDWYEALGTTVAAGFADPVNNPPPTATEIKVIANVVKEVIQSWLVANNIDPNTFDLISTPFTANHTGFDKVLDQTVVNTGGGTITITGSSVTQSTSYLISNGVANWTTSTTAGGTTSSSFNSAFVPTSASAQTALNGVLTTLSNMATVVNAKGTGLAAADILPFVDSGYLGGGKNATQFATSMASDLAGKTLNSFTVDHILSFDTTKNIIAIAGQVTITSGTTKVVQQVNGNDNDGLIFKLENDGSWKFYGDGQRAKINMQTETSLRLLGTGSNCTTGCDGVYYDLQLQVNAATTTVTSATVMGNIGGSTQTLSMTKASGTVTDSSGLVTDQFDLLGPGGTFYGLTGPSQFPPAGSLYTFSVAFSDLTTANYTRKLGGSTPEAMSLQSGVEATVGHSASATLGKSVTLSWNLPVTFPIASVEMYAHVTDTNGNGCDTKGPNLAANATTGTMILPATCNSLSVQIGPSYPSISVVVTGTSGESTNIWYAFQ
ncbi:MAG: hypothetical protein ACYDBV_05605 [Nitrospiria bacterium]